MLTPEDFEKQVFEAAEMIFDAHDGIVNPEAPVRQFTEEEIDIFECGVAAGWTATLIILEREGLLNIDT